MEREIGNYTEGRDGPLLICVGGMHGNEPAGVTALGLVLKMLEVEPITNPSFQFRGKILALHGNIAALQQERRYLDRDLNRIWSEKLDAIADSEAQERKSLLKAIECSIEKWQHEIIFLDLHTTTATGGIFSFPHDSRLGHTLAERIGAPVILGINKLLKGTCASFLTMRYEKITSIVFEGGQHTEEASVNRMIAAIVSCLRAAGCVDGEHIAHQHDQILTKYSQGLPGMSRVVYRHGIRQADGFRMNPGYKNFDAVERGQIVAHSDSGPVRAPSSGMILMPHYQELGEDGFFIIQEKENA